MHKQNLIANIFPRIPPGAIFTVCFDDETRSLELIQRTPIPEDQPISWLTLSHDRRNIYGAGMKKWGSYTVDSPTEITHHKSIDMEHHPRANAADTKTRAIFVLAAKKAPYLVYGNPFYDFAGAINVHSVNEQGGLEKCVQNAELDEKSAVHGMVFDKDEECLYSADMWANKIWTHRKVRPPFLLPSIHYKL
jgi:carboxy-cis,cis-muconate cyclase